MSPSRDSPVSDRVSSGKPPEIVDGPDRAQQGVLLRRLGRSLGVLSITCDGDFGPFEGAIEDEIVHGIYLASRTWSPRLHELLAERLFPHGEGTFIDVGANIGLVSIPLAERRGVHCIAFEPAPRNFELLRRNIEAHGVGACVSAHDVALYSERGEVSFELSATNSGDHRVRTRAPGAGIDPAEAPGEGEDARVEGEDARVEGEDARVEGEDARVEGEDTREEGEDARVVIQVRAERLDDLIEASALARPIVMKVDAQGSEVRILAGARRSLEVIDYLICEYWPYGLRRIGDDPEALLEILGGLPYGALLEEQARAATPGPVEAVLDGLRGLPRDGSSLLYADVLLARRAEYVA